VKAFQVILPVLFFLASKSASAQPIEKIKFAKNATLIYFFQKGPKSDSVIKNKSDLFYLLVPDSMKASFSLIIDNGRLTKTTNDSVFKLENMPGLKYETFYQKSEAPSNTPNRHNNHQSLPPVYELQTLINGTTEKERNTILIRITDKKNEKLILENNFYFIKPGETGIR